MKSARKNESVIRLTFIMIALTVTLILSGCSEDETPPLGSGLPGTGALTVEMILFNPGSPAPGDTVRATAVVTSTTPNVGAFATFAWSAGGQGEFLESDQTSVRWVAPDTATYFPISVTASNSVSSSSLTENVFVSRWRPFVEMNGGELHPASNGDVYYLSPLSDPVEPNFFGMGINVNDGVLDRQIVKPTAAERLFNHQFNNDLTLATYEVWEPGPSFVSILELPGGGTTDLEPTVTWTRLPAYSEPFFSPIDPFITYEAFFPDQIPPTQGGVDSFYIYTYDMMTLQERRITVEFDVNDAPYNNFHPTVSSDGNHLVFVSDRTGIQRWELYALPISGGVVARDTTQGALVQLSNTGGLIGREVDDPPDLPKSWNPNAANPVLAITDRDNTLHLVPTDGTGSISVAIPGGVTDFAWMANGSQLAATNGASIFTISLAGAATPIHDGVSGDRLGALSWSSDGEYLVFSVVRQGDTWYEVLDFGGSSGLTKPLKISAAIDAGEVETFAALMTTRPAWISSEPTAYYLFFNSETPSIRSLSVSGLAP